mmetsp:Transcript_53069/g.139495  ORF Transcript_53069/g.139495 Transcript_53069/m.139495 type:complete len:285 (+) Transcript_53069:266-1120(+)
MRTGSSRATRTRCSSCARWTTGGSCCCSILGAAHQTRASLRGWVCGRRGCAACWAIGATGGAAPSGCATRRLSRSSTTSTCAASLWAAPRSTPSTCAASGAARARPAARSTRGASATLSLGCVPRRRARAPWCSRSTTRAAPPRATTTLGCSSSTRAASACGACCAPRSSPARASLSTCGRSRAMRCSSPARRTPSSCRRTAPAARPRSCSPCTRIGRSSCSRWSRRAPCSRQLGKGSCRQSLDRVPSGDALYEAGVHVCRGGLPERTKEQQPQALDWLDTDLS